ncbi:MAG: SDR family NAD(P)-dependent oxidoreductase [Candidatus Krumholzibacteriia bacterium]
MENEPVYLVLGATGGIGSATARMLAASGARLLLAGRSADKLAALGAELDAPTCSLDAREPGSVEAAATAAVTRYGRLDGIANLVGSLLLKPAHLTSVQEWQETLELHANSSFGAVRAAAAHMRKQGGAVVLVSSAAARLGLANHEAIAAAKGAVQGLALAAAATYAPFGIRVNVVAPGLVETPLTAAITGTDALRKGSEAMHALGRIGRPQEVASAVAWLLHPDQAWVTGQIIGVDGGLATVRSRRA